MKIFLRAFAAFTVLLCAKLEAGNLKVSLTPSSAVTAGAQWRVDSGTWRNSDVTVSNLTNATHTVDFKSVTGWVSPAAISAVIANGQTTALTASYVQTASLKITLAPSSGQWRVDGGSWQTSAATLANLKPGSHSIDYSSVTGYITPTAETVTLNSGQTTTLSRSYVQLAQVTVTLTPSNGRWRIDGGAWRTGGTTATNLTLGSHLLEYLSVTGYSSPDAENINLSAGQALNLSRNYIQLAKLKVTLSPTSGQWRVDGGAWNASAATVSNLTVGTHTVDYAAVSGYITPASESVSLASGQTLTFTRTYVKVAQLTVTLTPSSGQWQVDGGAWNASGATANNLAPGAHTVAYSTVTNYASPATETVNLTAGQSLSFARTYTALAKITITLVPSTGQWRANGGAWQASGNSVWVLPGNSLVEYLTLPLYDSPASENLTLAAGGVFSATRSYVSQKPSLRINLTPSTGQWRVDGGAWNASGAIVTELAIGNHTIDYSDVGGVYAPLASETVSLAARQNAVLARAYANKPPASLSIVLAPNSAQWRVDGGAWQASGATVANLAYSSAHTVDYSSVNGYSNPASESLSLTSGQTLSLTRNYIQLAEIILNLVPTSGQWRANGGAWQTSGASLFVPAGNYSIDYSVLELHDSPPTETITVVAGGIFSATRNYVSQRPTLRINLSPAEGQWRVDSGAWQNSGNQVTELEVGSHTVDYSDLNGDYNPIPSESISLALRQNATLTRNYPIKPASVVVTLNPTQAQWRIYAPQATPPETWQSSGAIVSGLTPGTYVIEYAPLDDYNEPDLETVELTAGQLLEISHDYAQLAGVRVVANPSFLHTQWKIDGGAWQDMGMYTYNLTFEAPHTIEFSSDPRFVTPPAQTVTLSSGEIRTITATYAPLASLYISVLPDGLPYQWRLDGGPWLSGNTADNISFGVPHTIDFSTVSGYVTPASQTVTLNSGEMRTINAAYTSLGSIFVNAGPNGIAAQWRIDGGAWRANNTSVYNVSYGVDHLIEFLPVNGYIAPASQTVQLATGEMRTVNATYTPLASVYVYASPNGIAGSWRIDGGVWRDFSTSVYNLTINVPHTIEFSNSGGYVTPATQTITLTAGEYRTVTTTYAPLASVYVYNNLNGVVSSWRIDGGTWQSTGTSAYNLALGVSHTVEFSGVAGYVAPPAQTFTLASGENRSIVGNYAALAAVYVYNNLNGAYSQWRIDGGAWLTAATSAYNLSFGVPHTVEFSDVTGYVTPAAQTFTLTSGEYRSIIATYTPLASVYVYTSPNGLSTQWRIDGGVWRNSGTGVYNLAFGVSHTVEFSDVTGYVTPPAQTFTLSSAEYKTVTATYTPFASLFVGLQPSSGQWRIDGGAWNLSGTTTSTLSIGSHTIDYSSIPGYITPPSETVNVVSGYNPSITRIYAVAHPASVTITLTPAAGLWQISPVGSPAGLWNASGATVSNLLPGNYTVSYSVVNGYDEPPAEIITLADDENRTFSRNYSASVFATIATTRDSGGSNPSGTASGTSTISCILATDGYLYYASYAEPGAGYGHIFRKAQNSSLYQELKRFGTNPADGFQPVCLFEGSDGMLYGCTKNHGTVFRLNKDGSGYAILGGGFAYADSINSLIEGSDGVLYGTTENGGGSFNGTVFKMNKDGSGYAQLTGFSISTGINPQGIVEGPDGMLYGTTHYRGSGSNGTLFKLNKNGTGLSVFKSFGGGLDGSTPGASLLVGREGVLYGTVSSGGTTNKGLVFRINLDGTNYQVLHSFTGAGSDGSDPETQLTEDAAGVLYGVTLTGGTNDYGTLFKLNKNGTGYTRLVNLTGGIYDGGWPRQRVLIAPGGMLYGSGSVGGTLNNGLLFSVAPDGTGFTVLHQNGTQYGVGPTYRVTAASDGFVYGTTTFGGNRRIGTLYRTTGDGTGYTVLHNFDDTVDGGLPLGQVAEASDGFLYGTTYGLQSADGTLYRIAKDGSAYSVIHRFDGGTDGKAAWSGVIEGDDGTLYGTCSAGGAANSGAVYRVNKDGSGFGLIHSFIGGASEGAAPKAELIQAADGRLYGTTSVGGVANLGTVFVLNKDGSSFTTLRQFAGGSADGANPVAPLHQGSDGNLYGTTPAADGQNFGTVYRLATNGSNYAVLKNFTFTSNGYDPAFSGLVEKAGKLYGTTARGGSFDKGAIYSMNLDGSGYQIWINLGTTASDGTNPSVGLSLAPNGMMYGTAYYGGRIASTWTIFRFVP